MRRFKLLSGVADTVIEVAMPAHKIGRLWKFNTFEVDEWIRQSGARETHGTYDQNA